MYRAVSQYFRRTERIAPALSVKDVIEPPHYATESQSTVIVRNRQFSLPDSLHVEKGKIYIDFDKTFICAVAVDDAAIQSDLIGCNLAGALVKRPF